MPGEDPTPTPSAPMGDDTQRDTGTEFRGAEQGEPTGPEQGGRDVVRGDADSDLAREPARIGAAAAPTGTAPAGTAPPQAAGAAATAGPASTPQAQRPAQPGASGQTPLFSDAQELSMQWQSVQVTFVDEPRRAVQDADRLVTEMMSRLSDLFRSQQQDLERAWHAGDEVSTEDLRVALQRYRSFFERLLSA